MEGPQKYWFFVVLTSLFHYVALAQEFCNCEYTIPEDFEPNCRVFGELGDEAAFPWLLASEECVAELNVSVSTLSREQLWLICPFSNSTNVNVQLLRNEVESGTSPAANTIRSLLPQFFQPDGVDSSTYILQDTFLDNRNSQVNCQVSQTLCWSVIRDHLTHTADVRGRACETLHSYQKTSMAEEQLKARAALCDLRGVAPGPCVDLQQQLEASLDDDGRSCESTDAPAVNVPLECDWTNPLPTSGATQLARAPLFLALTALGWFACLL